LPHWSGKGVRQLRAAIQRLHGVVQATPNHHTGNVLIYFDPRQTTSAQLLAGLSDLRLDARPTPRSATYSGRAAVIEEQVGRHRRARIPVRGMERDPSLAQRVVERLECAPGVQAEVNPLTGRVQVDYDEKLVHLEDLLAEVALLELPCLPGEDEPAHPLDPRPLVRSATRAIAAALGLGFVTLQRLVAPAATTQEPAAVIAGVLSMLQGFPVVNRRLRRVLGETGADVATHGIAIVALTAADIPLGLVLAGAEALLLLGVVTQRRAAWRRYEEGLDPSTLTAAGSVIRLEPGMRVPRDARVVEGTGTALGRSGRILELSPGLRAPAGARVAGGPFVLELLAGEPFVPQPRTTPPQPDLYRRYQKLAVPASLGYAVWMGVVSGSLFRALEALLLFNARPAQVGEGAANLNAAARVLRAGLTIVGGRPKRVIRRPDCLLLDGARLLSDGKELDRVLPLADGVDADMLLTLAASVAVASGSPLGKTLQVPDPLLANDGSFDGKRARARIDGVPFVLRAAHTSERCRLSATAARQGPLVLVLERAGLTLGLIGLRPKLLPGVARLVEVCRANGVELAVLPGRDSITARRVTDRAGVALLPADDAGAAIRARQAEGKRVAFASDGAHAASAFCQCDFAIGMAAGHNGYFPAQADFLAPDLIALADFIDTGVRRDRAVRDSVVASTLFNLIGIAVSATGPIGLHIAFIPGYATALAAMGLGLLRLRGGDRPESALGYLCDPRPERWGRRAIANVLRAFHTTEVGLTTAAAARRLRPRPASQQREDFLAAVGKQLRSPTMRWLAGGACVTLILGQPLNTVIIGTSLSINVAAGLWQEREVSRGGEAVQRLGAPTARVLRDGRPVTIPAADLVPGDVILLRRGDRVPADARLLSCEDLEINEATLTGESLPVVKAPSAAGDHGCIVLEGTDVVVGAARAVVVAVGRHTRLGATVAAMNANAQRESPLGIRLARVLRVAVPVALTGGFITAVAGISHGTGPLLEMITLGVTTTLSTIPDGLPVLAGIGSATGSRRLAQRHALVRRMAGIEVLGRVDVACTDKTGTLTEGRLAVSLVSNLEEERTLPATLEGDLRLVLRAAGLASPHPDDPHATLHQTDVAVIRAACEAGLDAEMRVPREAATSFDSTRAYHAARANGRVYVKGAPERLIPRCTQARGVALDEDRRRELRERAHRLAGRGLRVLLVAEGPGDTVTDDPQELTSVGFVAMSDPLRPTAADAVARCHEAGIRVLMLTGDHLGTACCIGREAGLFREEFDEAVTADELHDLRAAELDRRLERVAIVARATPVDKVRIIESLRRRGHTVAMTGDGANDAPAVRLADVGVAMGRSGTEAARQAADVVLADDDFAHLADALIEGRSLWRHMRHALGLLLGGNAGELGLIAGVTVAGYGSPLTATQILLVSLITDTLPSLAIAMRPPRQRNLSRLAREGLAGLDASIPRDTFRRGLATGVPTLGAYLWTHAVAGPLEANAVAFASIICSQLAQTVETGHTHGILSRSVVGAVGGSLALLGVVLGVPQVRDVLGLVAPSAQGWGTVAASSAAAVVISKAIGTIDKIRGGHDWRADWKDEWARLWHLSTRLLPAPQPAAAQE
jgi:calcium-translocating P-type ATPase